MHTFERADRKSKWKYQFQVFFIKNTGYYLSNCIKFFSTFSAEMMKYLLRSSEERIEFTKDVRILPIHSASDHRHTAWTTYYERLECGNALEVLTCLFLFGISLDREDVSNAIGEISMNCTIPGKNATVLKPSKHESCRWRSSIISSEYWHI